MADILHDLIDALRCLPGVGPKSAQRMAFYLLQQRRQRGLHLADCLQRAMNEIQHCNRCNNYTTEAICKLCQNPNRNSKVLCIVENPADVLAIEQSGVYQGGYYVLMGMISPLDGIGPAEIGLPRLKELVFNANIQEVILALSPSVEGQTTTHFIHELLQPFQIRMSQLARGIPTGGDLELLDSHTISNALLNRSEYSAN